MINEVDFRSSIVFLSFYLLIRILLYVFIVLKIYYEENVSWIGSLKCKFI